MTDKTEKADIRELAVAAWRLEKWLDNLNADRKMAAKSALRSIKKYITASGIEIMDPVGSKFDPGLAVEVVNNEAEEALEEELIITETLAPYIYQRGELIQYARVIIGTSVKEAKENNAVSAEKGADALIDKSAERKEGTEIGPQFMSDSMDDEGTISAEDIERLMIYAKIL